MERQKQMKKWIAVLLAAVMATNMIACDVSDISPEDLREMAGTMESLSGDIDELSPEDIEIMAKALNGIADEMENSDLEERLEEFTDNLHPEYINPANLHWERLTLEDYEALGFSVEELEEAGLVLDELGLGDLEPSDIDFEKLDLIDLQSLGLGDLTLDDLMVELNPDALEMSPAETYLFLSGLSEEALKAIGLGDVDLAHLDLNAIDLNNVDLSGLEQFLADAGIDPVDFILSNIDLKSVDLNNPLIKEYIVSQLTAQGIDLASLGVNLDDLDLNAIDLEALGIDFANFDLNDLDLEKINLDAIDFDRLGIKPEDILQNLNLNDPMVKDYVVGALAAEGIDLASLGIDLDDIDLNAIDLASLGIDLNNLDPETFDLSKINLNAIDFDRLGIKPEEVLKNLDLNDPMVKEFIIDSLAEEGINLKSFGIDIDDLDLNAIDLTKIGLDLDNLDLNALDLENPDLTSVFDISKLNLDAIDFDRLGIKPEEVLQNVDLSDPVIKDAIVSSLAAEGIDLESLGIDLEDIDLHAIDFDSLGIDLTDLDPEALDFTKLNLNAIDFENLGIQLDDIDLNSPVVRDFLMEQLTAEGIDLKDFGIDIDDLDLNAIDLDSLGIDLNDLDLNGIDLSGLNLNALDLEKIGIKLEDLDLNNPMIREYIQSALDEEGINLEDYGISLQDIDFNNPIIRAVMMTELNPDDFDITKLSLGSLGLTLEDLNPENLSFVSPIVQNYVFSQIGLDELDLDALNLEQYGISLDDLGLEELGLEGMELEDLHLEDLGLDPEELDIENLSLEDLGITAEDLDFENLDLEDLDIEDLHLEDLSLEDLGIRPEDIELDDITFDFHLQGIGLEELGFAPEELDIEVKLEDLSMEELMEFMDGLDLTVDLAEMDLDDFNLDNPVIQDYLISLTSLVDVDFDDIDLGALSLDDLNFDDLAFLGLEDLDLADLELEGLDLDDLDLDEIDLDDLDPSQLTIGDLVAFGVTVQDLESAGLVPTELAGELSSLLEAFAELETMINQGAIPVADETATVEEAEEAEEEAEAPEAESEDTEKLTAAEEDKTVEEAEAAEEAEAVEKDEAEAVEKDEAEAVEKDEAEAAAEETAKAAEEESEEVAPAADDSEDTAFLAAEKPEPKDDFYGAIDYDIAKKAEIPSGYSEWCPIIQSRVDTDAQLKNIIQDAGKEADASDPGSVEYRISALYETLMDMDARNEAGAEPIKEWIDRFEKADSMDDLLAADLAYMEDTGNSAIIGIGVGVHPEDSRHYVITLDTMLHGPDRSIMVDEGMDTFRDAYLVYLGEIFRAAGYDYVDSALRGAAAYAIQTNYEEHTLPTADARNPKYTNNLFTQEELEKKLAHLPIAEWLKTRGADEASGYKTYQVADLKALEYLNSIYNEDSLEMLKSNAISTIIGNYAPVLGDDFYQAYKRFSDTCNGIEQSRTLEEDTIHLVNGLLSTDVGMLYTKKYCSDETKDDVESIIEDCIEAYYGIIENNDWMTEETKKRAMEKLDKLQINVAYPDQWDNSSKKAEILSVADGGNAFDNCQKIEKAVNDYWLKEAKGRVNRNTWQGIQPQTVNAFYDPSGNSIYICAGILQGAIYDPDADYGTNLGAIGMVIAHELSHAFDATGAQYDAEGNLENWWTEEDLKAFEERAQEVADYYNSFVVVPGEDATVDGALTVTENMADLGALKAIEAVCDGDQEMFRQAAESFARVWATKINRNALLMALKTDVHSPARARVNVPLQMCDLFYDVYDVKENDGMYVAPEDRVGLW